MTSFCGPKSICEFRLGIVCFLRRRYDGKSAFIDLKRISFGDARRSPIRLSLSYTGPYTFYTFFHSHYDANINFNIFSRSLILKVSTLK